MTNQRPARPPARRGLSEVASWAQTLDAEHLPCRDLGHTWQPYRAREDRKAREYVQTLRCARCTAERIRRLDYRGRAVGQHYAYPDGYLAPAGSGVLTVDGRADVRLQSLLRLVETDADGGVEQNSDEPSNLAAHRARKAG